MTERLVPELHANSKSRWITHADHRAALLRLLYRLADTGGRPVLSCWWRIDWQPTNPTWQGSLRRNVSDKLQQCLNITHALTRVRRGCRHHAFNEDSAWWRSSPTNSIKALRLQMCVCALALTSAFWSCDNKQRLHTCAHGHKWRHHKLVIYH